jgi:hypothetical protein
VSSTTVAFVISRPSASGFGSPLASSAGPLPKNTVRSVPANACRVAPPSAPSPDEIWNDDSVMFPSIVA